MADNLITGKILPGCLVASGVHCRLENISLEEPAVWLQTEEFWVGSERVYRKRGEKVGPKVMSEWRKFR